MKRAQSGGSKAARCLLVQSGDQVCALPLGRVRRVVRALTVSPLPGAAPELLGLAEFGGEPLPVLDLAHLLTSAHSGAPVLPVTVVVVAGPEGSTELVGLAADAALDIAEVPLAGRDGGHGALVATEALVAGRPVRVLDLSALGAPA